MDKFRRNVFYLFSSHAYYFLRHDRSLNLACTKGIYVLVVNLGVLSIFFVQARLTTRFRVCKKPCRDLWPQFDRASSGDDIQNIPPTYAYKPRLSDHRFSMPIIRIETMLLRGIRMDSNRGTPDLEAYTLPLVHRLLQVETFGQVVAYR